MHKRVIVIAGLILAFHGSAQDAVAQIVQQGAKLVGTGGVGASFQGHVALSADGNTLIAGGPNDNGAVGAVWVFTRSGGLWTQQGAKLGATGAVGTPNRGYSVAVSADGNTAAAGGYSDNGSVGAVWVYTRNGSVWSQQGGKLVGTGGTASPSQGQTIAMSADGNTLIVGGPSDNTNAGATWVYTRSAGVWSQQGGKLVGTGAAGAGLQGISVALSADGNTAVVGGLADNSYLGAAWVFTRSAGVWTQQGAKLVGTVAVGAAQQGYSVAVSGDGNTTVVGGNADNGYTGAAWVFARSGGVWSQQGAKLVGTGAVGNGQQGYSVAASADGNVAVVGGYFDNGGTGANWIYNRRSGVWSQQGTKLVGTGATGGAYQGSVVTMSADANTIAWGGYADNSSAGASWVFINPSPKVVSITDVPNEQGGKVSLRWTPSLLDRDAAIVTVNPVNAYWIWRQVPAHSAVRQLAGRAIRTSVQGGQVYYWEYLGSQVTHGFPSLY